MKGLRLVVFLILTLVNFLWAQATRPVVRIDIQPDGCFSPCNSDNIRFKFTVVDMDGYPSPTTPFIPVVFGGDPGFRFNAKSLGVGGTYDTTFSCAGRNNGAYRWEIRYYNAGADQYQPCNYEGASPANFTISCGTTDTCSGVTPPRPTGFTVEPGSRDGEIRLSWDRSRCATTYNIQRTRPSARSWSVSGTSAVDSGLDRGVSYCYKVQACNGSSLCSVFTAEMCDTPCWHDTASCSVVIDTFEVPDSAYVGQTITLRWHAYTRGSACTCDIQYTLTYGSVNTNLGNRTSFAYTVDGTPGNSITFRLVARCGDVSDTSTRRLRITAPPRYCVNVGNLRVCLNSGTYTTSGDTTKFNGTITINDLLYVGGALWVIPSDLQIMVFADSIYIPIRDISGNARILMDYVGIFDIDESVMSFVTPGINGLFTAGGFPVTLNSIDLSSNSITILGGINIEHLVRGEFKLRIGTCTSAIECPPFDALPRISVYVDSSSIFSSVNKGGFILKNLSLTLNLCEGRWGGSATVEWAGNELNGEIEFLCGKLNKIIVSYHTHTSPGFPINATGLFLTQVGGGFDNIAEPPITLVLICGISGGPRIMGVSVVELRDMTLRIRVPISFEGSGRLFVMRQEVAEGGVRLNSEEGIYLWGKLSILNIFTGVMSAQLRAHDFEGSLSASIHTPHFDNILLAPFSDRDLGRADVAINNNRLDVELTVSIGYGWLSYNQRIGLRFEYANGLHFYAGLGLENLIRIFKNTAFDPSQPIFVPQNTPQAIFIVYRKSSEGSVPPFKMLMPDGHYASGHMIEIRNYLSRNPEISLNDSTGWTFDTTSSDFDRYNMQYFIVDNPIPGNWYFVLPDSVNPNDFKYLAYKKTNAPVVKILNANTDSATIYASDIDDSAKIYLFIDKDAEGTDGIRLDSLFRNGIFVSDTSLYEHDDTFNVAYRLPRYLRNGDYYLYAVVDDGRNVPNYYYYPEPIHITNGDTLPRPLWFEVLTTDTSFIFKVPKPADTTWQVGIYFNDDTSSTNYKNSLGFQADTVIADTLVMQILATDTMELDTIKYCLDSTCTSMRDTTVLVPPVLYPGRTYRFASTYFYFDSTKLVESGYSNSQLARVYLRDRNNPPHFLPHRTEYNLIAGQPPVIDTLHAFDFNGDTLRFGITDTFSWLYIDSITGILTISPNYDNCGAYRVKVWVADRDSIYADTLELFISIRDTSSLKTYIALDRPEYVNDSSHAVITVKDWNANRNREAQDTITAELLNTSIRCVEIENNSGIFVGAVLFRDIINETNRPEEGDTIWATYNNGHGVDSAYAFWRWIMPKYLLFVRSQFGYALGTGYYQSGDTATVRVGIVDDSGFVCKDTIIEKCGDDTLAKRIFDGWDDTLVSGRNSGRIVVLNNDTINAMWESQYIVTVVPGHPEASVYGSGWYKENDTIHIGISRYPSSSSVDSVTFAGWEVTSIHSCDSNSVDTLTSPDLHLTITGPVRIKGLWKIKHYLVVNHFGSSSTETGTGWYENGTEISICSIPDTSEDVRFLYWGDARRCCSISDTESLCTHLTVNCADTITAYYGYFIMIIPSGLEHSSVVVVDSLNNYPLNPDDTLILRFPAGTAHKFEFERFITESGTRSVFDSVAYDDIVNTTNVVSIQINGYITIVPYFHKECYVDVVMPLDTTLSCEGWHRLGDTVFCSISDTMRQGACQRIIINFEDTDSLNAHFIVESCPDTIKTRSKKQYLVELQKEPPVFGFNIYGAISADSGYTVARGWLFSDTSYSYTETVSPAYVSGPIQVPTHGFEWRYWDGVQFGFWELPLGFDYIGTNSDTSIIFNISNDVLYQCPETIVAHFNICSNTEIDTGFNMFSYAFRSPVLASSLFRGLIVAYRYDTRRKIYVAVDTLIYGQGYWICSLRNESLKICHPSLDAVESFVDTLYPGWNMIGVGIEKVFIDSLFWNRYGDILYRYLGFLLYNTSRKIYERADTLQPGNAYWILALDTIEYKLEGTKFVIISHSGKSISPEKALIQYGSNPPSPPASVVNTVIEDYTLDVSPSPFNKRLSIHYNIINDGDINISIFDVLGRHIETLLDCKQVKGSYEIYWEPKATTPSGLYFIKMETNNISIIKRAILIK